MTKKLEEEFNLPPLKEALEEDQEETEEVETKSEALTIEREEIFTALKAADKIDQALPTVRGLETNDVDMDSYSNQAEQAFKDLMDLGIADSILPEPEGGTHFDYDKSATTLKEAILSSVNKLIDIDPNDRIENRIKKYEKMGRWTDG